MGAEVDPAAVGREQRRAHRRRLHQSLAALETMLAQDAAGGASLFEAGEPSVGMEVELTLVDADHRPHRQNTAVLAGLDGEQFQPEIGAHTLELNLPPTTLAGQGMARLEEDLRAALDAAQARAAAAGTGLLLTGVLPTLEAQHLTGGWMTPSPRYRALQEAVLEARGEDVEIDITGPGPDGEHLSLVMASIAAESACTSTQLHLKVAPDQYAATWNAAQLLMGPQLALGANSPFALGRRLWAETRVELFTQSVDTRPPELIAQGVRPRVFPGEGWAGSVLDLFTQNVTWFPGLLPVVSDQDPLAELDAGRAPALSELNLHSGTVWRWNRPVYDVVDGLAHLRVENRVLPSGPSVVDTLANAALFYGALRVLVEDGPDPRGAVDPASAVDSFTACARRGLDAEVTWPGLGVVGVRALLLEHLLPMAADGLGRAGVAAASVDRYVQIAEARAASGVTGAVWQQRAVAALEERGMDRPGALRAMVGAYAGAMHAGDPVHTWPLP